MNNPFLCDVPLVTGVRGRESLTLLNVPKGFCASQNAAMKSAHQATGAEEVNWSEIKRLIRKAVHQDTGANDGLFPQNSFVEKCARQDI